MTVAEIFDGPVIVARDLFCLHPAPDGMVAALRGLSLEVPAGQRLLVHGPNGSGKTTLLRVLMGVQSPSAGMVRVAGVDLTGADERERTQLRLRRLGVVDQHTARSLRPELTVLDNVALGLRLGGTPRSVALERAAVALDALGIGGLSRRAPATLSGGEAQRVAVCAAVAHEPLVVLADEPTGELDAAASDRVYDLLAEAVERIGATLVLVTHDQGAARIADRVVRIRDGRLSEEWEPWKPTEATLVVDDRGWLRLPDELRAAARADNGVRAEFDDGAIVLRGTGTERTSPPIPAATVPVTHAGGPVVTADQLNLAYAARPVLRQFSMTVDAGALTVVAGRSGAGKSSLLRILLGLTEPDDGDVTLFGIGLRDLDRAGRADLRRQHVAVAAQNTALVEALSVLENLELARTVRGLPADTGLAAKVIDSLGLAALRDRPARLLSGGERQRVALARCLVSERPLVVLDEPTSQQDEWHAELVAAALGAAVSNGTAVLCASHDPVITGIAEHRVELA